MDFSEKQKLNSRVILVTFLFSSMVTFIAITFAMRQMIEAHENFYAVALLPVLLIVVLGFAYYLLFHSELETSVDRSGFSYRYFPFIRKLKLIDFHEMNSWKICSKKSLSFTASYGYKRSLLSKRTSIILGSYEFLELTLNNGKTYLFSTDNYYGLSSALRKYAADKELD